MNYSSKGDTKEFKLGLLTFKTSYRRLLRLKDTIGQKNVDKVSEESIMNYAEAAIEDRGKNMLVKSSGKILKTSWKKAVVTLKEGFSIDLMSGGPAE